MFVYFLFSITIGIICGILTGLIPGIHINLVATLLLIIVPLLKINITYALFFMLSVALTHTFLDSIPSIFLGVPDENTLIAALPGHQYTLQGHGYEAVKITVIGSFFALLFVFLFIPLLFYIIPFIHTMTSTYIIYILFFFIIINPFREKGINIVWGLIITLLSGLLGLFVLESYTLQHPFFHLFSGLFGVSSLLFSLQSTSSFPEQFVTDNTIKIKQMIPPTLSSLLGGTLTAIIPGIGNAHAATIALWFTRFRIQTYLILQGGINTTSMIISFIALVTIQKARNGVVLAIQSLTSIDIAFFIPLCAAALLIGSICIFLGLFSATVFIDLIKRISYQKISLFIIFLLVFLSIIFDSWYGLIVLGTSTVIGLLPLYTQTKRSTTMSCLLLPLLLFYLPVL